MVKLGSRVRDVMNGYEGIATARTVFLNGCISVCIEGPMAKDDKGVALRDEVWFDEQRVRVLKEGAFSPQGEYATQPKAVGDERMARAGGPTGPTPPRDGAH